MSASNVPYCVGFAFYRYNLVLILKNRPEKQKGFLNGVGGKLEQDETALQSMVREFQEETLVSTNPNQWVYCGVLSEPYIGDVIVNFFACNLTLSQYLGLVNSLEEENKQRDEPIVVIDFMRELKQLHANKKTMYNLMDLIINCYCKLQSIFDPVNLSRNYFDHPYINRLR